MATLVPINVDLNKLFEARLTYSFDPLKEAIEVRFFMSVENLNILT